MPQKAGENDCSPCSSFPRDENSFQLGCFLLLQSQLGGWEDAGKRKLSSSIVGQLLSGFLFYGVTYVDSRAPSPLFLFMDYWLIADLYWGTEAGVSYVVILVRPSIY